MRLIERGQLRSARVESGVIVLHKSLQIPARRWRKNSRLKSQDEGLCRTALQSLHTNSEQHCPDGDARAVISLKVMADAHRGNLVDVGHFCSTCFN